jgi:intracellular sulfur oxidation DsrE/DsrF family protein
MWALVTIKGRNMKLMHWFSAIFLLLATGLGWSQDRVVYHVSDADAQALTALRNIRNHLDTDPTAKIILVAHAQGVDFLMEGAKDKNGSLFSGPISALKSRGVTFEVCQITLKTRNLKEDQFIQEADFTPSGVVRLTKLQAQGYAYIRP